jgi:hypothetical protein
LAWNYINNTVGKTAPTTTSAAACAATVPTATKNRHSNLKDVLRHRFG